MPVLVLHHVGVLYFHPLQVLFRKLIFDTFYQPSLSEACGTTDASGTSSVNPDHQCAFSLAAIACIRTHALYRSVSSHLPIEDAATYTAAATVRPHMF